ncbi:hypothetical protein HER21_44750, partial [Pseudomonas sp. BGM005]|nr:hypothetical protein [Pseudomonas sp. BG5]
MRIATPDGWVVEMRAPGLEPVRSATVEAGENIGKLAASFETRTVVLAVRRDDALDQEAPVGGSRLVTPERVA